MLERLMNKSHPSRSSVLLTLILSSFLLLFLFQNCSPNKIDTNTIDISSSSILNPSNTESPSGNGQGYDGLSSGNGQGYDGKMQLSGTYYRWIPNYTCNLVGNTGAPFFSYEKSIVFNNTDPMMPMPTLTSDLCNSYTPMGMSPSEIESFSFSPNLIFFRAQVLEKTLNAQPNPNGFINLFCKSSPIYAYFQTLVGVNIAIRQRVGDTRYYAEIYYGDVDPQDPLAYIANFVAPFQVSRVSGTTTIDYTASGFSLSLDAQNIQQAYVLGNFVDVYPSSYTATINQNAVSATLNCYNQ